MVRYHYISKWITSHKLVKNWFARRDFFGHMPLLQELNKNDLNVLKNYLRMQNQILIDIWVSVLHLQIKII